MYVHLLLCATPVACLGLVNSTPLIPQEQTPQNSPVIISAAVVFPPHVCVLFCTGMGGWQQECFDEGQHQQRQSNKLTSRHQFPNWNMSILHHIALMGSSRHSNVGRDQTSYDEVYPNNDNELMSPMSLSPTGQDHRPSTCAIISAGGSKMEEPVISLCLTLPKSATL